MGNTGQLLVEVQEQVDHLLDVRTEVTGPDSLRRDVGLRNDLLYGLLNLSRAAGEIAANLSEQRDVPYEDGADALRRVDRLEAVPEGLADRLRPFARLSQEIDGRPSTTDYEPVIAALYELEPVKTFARFAAGLGVDAGAARPAPGHDRIAPRRDVDLEGPGDADAPGFDAERTADDATATGTEPNGG